MSTSKTGIITLSTHKLEFIANIAAKIGLQKIIKFLMIFFINCYQKYLSPYKGFSCAYRKLYQAESCSEYFKIAIANTNLTTAIPLFQKRLVDCKLASRTLKVNSNYPQKKKKSRNQEPNEYERFCDCLSWWEFPLDLLTCDLTNIDCADCNFCDCDLGGCDF